MVVHITKNKQIKSPAQDSQTNNADTHPTADISHNQSDDLRRRFTLRPFHWFEFKTAAKLTLCGELGVTKLKLESGIRP